MNLIFAEKNKKLRDLFKEKISEPYQIEVVEDVFAVADGNFIATCSNPDFNPGGGLDGELAKKYPKVWKQPKSHLAVIDNLIFIQTVDKKIKANRKKIKQGIKFIIEFAGKRKHKDTFKVVFTGMGTGIGRLSEEEFISLFLEVIQQPNIKFGDEAEFGDGAKFGDRAKFGDGAEFGDGAKFGDWAEFGHGAKFGDGAEFGDGAKFGDRAEFGDGAEFGDRAKFGDRAEFGDWAEFGHGAKFGHGAEFRHGAKFGDGIIKHPSFYGNVKQMKSLGLICEKKNPSVKDFWKVHSREKTIIDGKDCFVFYKVVKDNYTTRGKIKYEVGKWITDPEKFAKKGSCVKGGIYFSHLLFVMNFSNSYSRILKIAVPVNQRQMVVDPEGDKCRAKKIYVLEELKEEND